MTTPSRFSLLFLFVLLSTVVLPARTLPIDTATLNIIPQPRSIQMQSGSPFEINAYTELVGKGDAEKVARLFAAPLGRLVGVDSLQLAKKNKQNVIELKIDRKVKCGDEGYVLEVLPGLISIKARTPNGLYYAMQTLMQMLPMERMDRHLRVIVVPAVKIMDEPSFAWRGMMLDPCRHWLPVEEVKRRLDAMAMFKMNTMHFHLTDDQAWRIEIKRYPELTEVGSKRVEGDGSTYGPYFYTQEEIKEIVAYAAERYITVVPEVEIPGHGMAAIATYPELTCFPKARDYHVRNIWGIEDDVYCAGRESTFEFIRNVLDEVAPLFPSKIFHIGGDESPKDRWKECPDCQARIRTEKLKDENDLQNYVVGRAAKMLARHGKRIIGWDEILEGDLIASGVVMSWQGEEGGLKAANRGHDVVMSPSSAGLYLDTYQGDPKIEPLAIGGYSTLRRVYSYHPVPAGLSPEKSRHILGVQGNCWSEYMLTPDIQAFRSFPRIIAVAEVAWTPQEKKDFEDFDRRLNITALPRLEQLGLNYHIPQPEQPQGSISQVVFVDKHILRFETTRPVERIVYTTDGSEPTNASPTYNGPIEVTEPMTIKAASVASTGRLSLVRTIKFDKKKYSPSVPKEALGKIDSGLLMVTYYTPEYEAAPAPNGDGIIRGDGATISKIYSWKTLLENPINTSSQEANLMRNNIAMGYLYIPADGIYAFETNNKELWVSGMLIVDNTKVPKKISPNDGSCALKAGYHPIRVVYRSAVERGWPAWWGNGAVRMRRLDIDDKYETVPLSQLIHSCENNDE